MTNKILEPIVNLFKELQDNEIWKDLSKEREHKKMIALYANNSAFLDELFVVIEKGEEDYAVQAFLILLESRDKKVVKELFKCMFIDRSRTSKLVYSITYLSEDTFDIFFQCLKKEGFEKTELHILTTEIILQYIAINMLEKYAIEFYNIEKFSQELQDSIIDELCYVPSANNMILKVYEDNNPYFSGNSSRIGFMFILQKREDLAFKYWRTTKNILDEYNDGVFFLNLFGDSSDGEIILNTWRENIDKKDEDDIDLLYKKLGNTQTITNHTLVNGLVDFFDIDNYALRGRIHYTLHTHYDILLDDRGLANYIQELLSEFDIYDGPDDIEEILSEFTQENKNYISAEFLIEFWSDVIKKHVDTKEAKQRKTFRYGSSPYSLWEEDLLDHKISTIMQSNEYDDLRIFTGQSFPLNGCGYYSQFQAHIAVWRKYLDENREKYEPGRWYRYGRYVDVEYKQIESKITIKRNTDIKNNILDKEIPTITLKSKEIVPKTGRYQATLPAGHPAESIIKNSGFEITRKVEGENIGTFGLSGSDEYDIEWRYVGE